LEQLLSTETIIIELLLIASLVAIAVQRLHLPYTVALVIVGLLIASQETFPLQLTPGLILALFVPPLVFEAAFHLRLGRLRSNLVPILVLAVPGVLITTVVVGLVTSAGIGLSFRVGLVFGALVAATDPVAVVALFRALRVPRRLAVLVEGESLLNDGTAIVTFTIVLSVALSATATTFSPLSASLEFLRVSVGGVVVGLGSGWLISELIARVDDYLIETTLTTVLAFGSYLIADRAGLSGVLAVVTAGLIIGNLGPRGMSPTTRVVLFNFWEYLAFVVNSLVFLLIGLQVDIPHLVANLGPIGIAVLGVVGSRILTVYGLTELAKAWRPRIPWAYRHVLFWGGLRGAVSLALALSLPLGLADSQLLRVMAFGVVLFTLLVQGTTMQFLLRRLGLVQREPEVTEYERRHGRLIATRAALDRLRRLYEEGMISAPTLGQLVSELEEKAAAERRAQHELMVEFPPLEREERQQARREAVRAQRAALEALMDEGTISESIYEELVDELDAAATRSEGERANDKDRLRTD